MLAPTGHLQLQSQFQRPGTVGVVTYLGSSEAVIRQALQVQSGLIFSFTVQTPSLTYLRLSQPASATNIQPFSPLLSTLK